ncbi:MAG: hypothetical protein L6Q38_19985, partial [Nitrospira sp.]|nr:hypothetical protein [Nitrospira sp.]
GGVRKYRQGVKWLCNGGHTSDWNPESGRPFDLVDLATVVRIRYGGEVAADRLSGVTGRFGASGLGLAPRPALSPTFVILSWP